VSDSHDSNCKFPVREVFIAPLAAVPSRSSRLAAFRLSLLDDILGNLIHHSNHFMRRAKCKVISCAGRFLS
jgi:hypothetical protein